MNLKQVLEKLVKKVTKEKIISQKDVLEFAELDSEEYFEIEKALLNLNVDIIEEKEEKEFDDKDNEKIEESEIEPDELSLSDLDVEEQQLDMNKLPKTVKIDDPVRMYLKEIGQIPLLKADEEKK